MNVDFIAFLVQNKIEYLLSEPLSEHTSFKIGGTADIFACVKNEAELKSVISAAKEFELNYFIIGKGSNLLVSDNGFRGVVISLCGEFENVELLEDGTIRCGAGASLVSLCKFALNHGLSGLEFAYGIPGSVGGAVFMNAGAYGGEIKDVIISATAMKENGEIVCRNKDELDLSYRHSVFENANEIVLFANFKLNSAPKEQIKDKMDALLFKRKDKQPLNFPSAGSTFKRPQGYFAAALIEEASLKGVSVGGAEVSEKHSGFIINKNNATCKDVLNLIDLVKQKVFEQFGVELETEVKYIC